MSMDSPPTPSTVSPLRLPIMTATTLNCPNEDRIAQEYSNHTSKAASGRGKSPLTIDRGTPPPRPRRTTPPPRPTRPDSGGAILSENNVTSTTRTLATTLPGVNRTLTAMNVNTSSYLTAFSVDDPENPRNFSKAKKLAIASFSIFAAFVATLGTPIYISASPAIVFQLNTSVTIAILAGIIYAWGIGIGALLFSGICEFYGRMLVYKITMPLCLLSTCLAGISESIIFLTILRFLEGVFAGPCLTVAVGIVNDLWDSSLDKAGTASGVILVLMIVWATQIGPMISAAIFETQKVWHDLFWTNAGFVAVVVFFSYIMPETSHPLLLRNRARRLGFPVPQRETGRELLIYVGRPLHMLLVEPIIFPSSLLLGITQAVVFSYYVAYAFLFESVYAFSQYQVGMTFGPMIIGSALAVPLVAYFDKVFYQPARLDVAQTGGTVAPEKRLCPAMLGCFTLPMSLLWLAWSGKRSIHWAVPCSSGLLFGFSYVLNMLCLPVYVNDIYGKGYGASAVASSTFTRFTISAGFPLFTTQMMTRLGFAWAMSILAAITLLMIPVPWVFWRWGPALRARSQYIVSKNRSPHKRRNAAYGDSTPEQFHMARLQA